MKKGLLILILALATGIAAFYLTRAHQQAKPQEVLLDSMPELAWLRSELALSEDQFAKVGALHADYRPQCAEMCRRISDARAKLDSLARESRSMSPELGQAIQELARVHADCRIHMVEHLYQTAALMDEKQASRYLVTVLPAALDTPTYGANSCPHH